MPKFKLVFEDDFNEEGLFPLSAEGSDDPGPYTMKGTFNPKTNEVTIAKDYTRWIIHISMTWNKKKKGFLGGYGWRKGHFSGGEWFIKPAEEKKSSSDSD